MNHLLKAIVFATFLTVSVRCQGPSQNYLPPGGGGGNGYPSTGGGGGGNGFTSSGGGGDEGGKPEPFSFSYEVKDAASGNDFSHKAESDGTKVTGEYQVLLPDGRRQKVAYTADEGGYNADVQYEGESNIGNGGGAGSTGAGGGYPSGGPSGGGYPSGGPSGGGFPSGGPSGGGYPSGGPSQPGGSYLPPGK